MAQGRGPSDPTANLRLVDERVKSPEIRLEERLSTPTDTPPQIGVGPSDPVPADVPAPPRPRLTQIMQYEWEPTRDNRGFGYVSADRFRANANFVEPAFKLNIDGSLIDVARDPYFELPELYFLRRENWERYQLGDLKATLSTIDDRLKITLREAHSLYMADAEILRRKDIDPRTKRGRFFGAFGAQGHGHHQRIDFTPIKSSLIEAGGFAYHTDLDKDFIRYRSAGAKKDVFDGFDRTTLKSGGKLRFASVTFTTARSESERISGARNPKIVSEETGVSVDLTDLGTRLGGLATSAIWRLLPATVYAERSNVHTVFKKVRDEPPDHTEVVSLGASWTWTNGYANFDFYEYYLDSRRVGDANYDSAGRGLGLYGGLWGDTWTLDGGFFFLRADDRAPHLRAKYSEYDVYLSGTYKPNFLPDISVDGSIGTYDYNGTAFNTFSSGTYWSGTVVLDFSKFFWRPPPLRVATRIAGQERETRTSFAMKGPYSNLPSLKVFYRIKGDTNEGDIGPLTPRHRNDHVVAAVFRTLF